LRVCGTDANSQKCDILLNFRMDTKIITEGTYPKTLTFPNHPKKQLTKGGTINPSHCCRASRVIRTRDGRSGLTPSICAPRAAHTRRHDHPKTFYRQYQEPALLLLLVILGLVLNHSTRPGNFRNNKWKSICRVCLECMDDPLVAAIIGVAILVNSIKNLIKWLSGSME